MMVLEPGRRRTRYPLFYFGTVFAAFMLGLFLGLLFGLVFGAL